jgi:ankyrin repeat protein
MAAASAGNAYALTATLVAGCNPDGIRDDHGNTPLLAAAQGGHTDCVMTLLRAGADIRTTNLKGHGVVHISFNHGHISLGTMLAEIQNDSSDGQGSNWTILLDECGVDSEAIMAAMDLNLDLNMFDTPKAPALDKLLANSDLSASARFLENVSKGILSTPHEVTGKDNPASTRNHRSHRKIPSLRLPGNCEEKEWSRGTGKILVPSLQLQGNVHDSMSTVEEDLVQAALEARNAEAEIFLAADLGCGQHDAHMNNKKKRAKIRSKDQCEEENPKKSAPLTQSVQRGAYISESITLIGKSQAALESEQAKMCRAQQEASDFDKEIQQQLDYSLLLAAQNGDVKSIKSWLEKGARVEAEDVATGNTALHFSALVGNKKCCKTLLREGAAVDLKNVNGQTAIDVAFCQGHTELGNYLKSKEEYLSSAVENIHDLEPENEHKSDDMSAMFCASSSLGVDFGRPEVVEDTCSMISNKNTSHILQVSRAAQSDVRGMVKQLRSLELTTWPRDTESETGWHSTGDSQDSGDEAINTSTTRSNPLALDDGNIDEFDVLKCAEEFLRTVSPAKGKAAFTGSSFFYSHSDFLATFHT